MKSLLLRGGAALTLFALIAIWHAGRRDALYPNPITFDLTLDPGEAGRADPLIVSGTAEAGDFLSVRFEDARTVRFVYDSWGVPGLVSPPVAIEPGVPLRMTVEMPALTWVRGTLAIIPDRVRVACNGTLLLAVTGQAYAREADQLYFGRNPIGGTSCGPVLHGRVTAIDG